jgi:predicted  nucleic acid-binding Zn-ribbon protein
MAEGDKTPGGEPGSGERDILAERRARREQGEGALARRAQEAEAAVRTLETHLSDLRGRLRDVEEEQRRTTEQLAEREHEIRRVKQREYAEQQLRVEAEEQRERLEREQRAEVDRLQRRLTAGERHARELTDRLESLRRELAEAEQAASSELAGVRRTERELSEREIDLQERELALERTRAEIEQRLSEAREAERQAREAQQRDERQLRALTSRLATLEAHAAELQREMDAQRDAREQSERELQNMRDGHLRMEQIVRELQGIALQLRGTLNPTLTPAAAPKGSGRTPREEEDHRLEMAKALAAAVERLRARVSAVDELEHIPADVPSSEAEPAPSAADVPPAAPAEPAPSAADVPPAAPAEPAPSAADVAPAASPEPAPPAEPPEPEPQPTPFTPRVLALPAERQSWLAPAIRRVAERHDAKLAAELICELLAAQGSLLKRALTYTLRIEGVEDVQVHIDGGRAAVRRLSAAVGAANKNRGAFLLEGAPADFAEFAAGGARRRLTGVRVRGSRRRARRLIAARRLPLELSDLAEADIRVWPGLLLLVLSEAIPAEWTVGHSFVLAFAIENPLAAPTSPSATIYVQVRDGASIAVTRVRAEAPISTVRLSERAFLCMLAGAPLPSAEQVLVDGPEGPLRLLLGWSDRIQGLAR